LRTARRRRPISPSGPSALIDQDEPRWLGPHDENIEWCEIAMHETASMEPCDFGSQRAQERMPAIDRASGRGAARGRWRQIHKENPQHMIRALSTRSRRVIGKIKTLRYYFGTFERPSWTPHPGQYTE